MQDLHVANYVPLVAWSAGIAILVQSVKYVCREAGIRHHAVIERLLPLLPLAVGAVSGALYPDALGVGAVTAGAEVPASVGGFFGLGAGAVSGQVFNTVTDLLPGGGDWLRLEDSGGADGGRG